MWPQKSTIDREEGKWARQLPLSKLLTPASADKKNSCTAQRLYTNDALSLILFSLITARLFSIATPFPALSILMIFPDRCQMKRFEDTKILTIVKLSGMKNSFFEKAYI